MKHPAQTPQAELDVTFEISGKFEASHRLKDHPWRCKNKHGHRYEVVALLSGEYDKKTGMLGWIDFGKFKKRIEKILDEYDHALILQKWDPELKHEKQKRLIITDYPPTTETLALRIFNQIEGILIWKYKTLKLQSVKLRETDKMAVMIQRPL